MPNPTVWLSEDAVGEMTAEVAEAAPNETGGMLLGWPNDDRNEYAVLGILGPGPGGVHTPTAFRPDGAWQQEQLAEVYRRSDGRVTYLGDWHVHPLGGFGLSRRDRRTMAAIASHAEARCPRPLTALLAWDGNGYRLGAWMWTRSRWHPRLGRVLRLPARSWALSAEERQLLHR